MFEDGRDQPDHGGARMPRRERLERIANAERDRRAGRAGMAIAAIGEPHEWPARVVVALALWPAGEGATSRQLLEAGLDLWARDLKLGSLAPSDDAASRETPAAAAAPKAAFQEEDLASPIDASEFEAAFDLAETEVESMHDVNSVAERVLADEPIGLAELSGETVALADEPQVLDAASSLDFFDAGSRDSDGDDVGSLDPSEIEAIDRGSERSANLERPAATRLATLERWLSNIERRRAERRV
jgi:hypothetical protein